MTKEDKKAVVPAVVNAYVSRMLTILDANNIHYRIEMPNGAVHDTLPKKAVAPKRKRRGDRMWGELTSYVTPFLKEVQIGGLVEIPFGPYTVKEMRSSVTANASNLWGNDSYVSSTNEDKRAIEVLRTA